jgi:hypothetical protein
MFSSVLHLPIIHFLFSLHVVTLVIARPVSYRTIRVYHGAEL